MSGIFRSSYGKLPAQDMERARAFYRDVLGFEPVREHRGHLFYECGGASFLVFPSRGAPSGTHDQLGFVVDDTEAAVAKLFALATTHDVAAVWVDGDRIKDTTLP